MKKLFVVAIFLVLGSVSLHALTPSCDIFRKNQEGWQKQWIPLGILRLFNRTFPLTITILGDKSHESSFQFYSEIYQ